MLWWIIIAIIVVLVVLAFSILAISTGYSYEHKVDSLEEVSQKQDQKDIHNSKAGTKAF